MSTLFRKFDDAARDVRAVLPTLDRKALVKAGCDVKALIKLGARSWKPVNGQRDAITCYAYALNHSHTRAALPGFIHLAQNPDLRDAFDQERRSLSDKSKKLLAFIDMIEKRVVLDGAVSTERTLTFAKGYYPIALFFGEKADLKQINPHIRTNDYTFYALRRAEKKDLPFAVWANRDLGKAVRVCGDTVDSIFTDASKRGYTYFGGFYNVKNPGPSHS